MNDLDIHLTRLFGWVVRLIGRALLVTMLGALVVSWGLTALFRGVFDDSTGNVLGPFFGLGLGALLFPIQLMMAQAPEPLESNEH